MFAVWWALLILSCPPAITISDCPERIDCAPIAIALNPEPQTWLTVIALFSYGISESIIVCLAGFCPCPPVKTWPIINSSISDLLIFEESINEFTTVDPISTEDNPDRLPKNLPIADLFAFTITTLDIVPYLYK